MQFDMAFVENMKRVAKEHPHQLDGGLAPVECLWENVGFEDERLNIMLTYEIHGSLRAWHLSVSRTSHTAAPPDIVDHIVGVVLGENVLVLPEHYFSPEVRFIKQFVQRITDE